MDKNEKEHYQDQVSLTSMATSFEELEQLNESGRLSKLGDQMSQIIKNIFSRPDITDKSTALDKVTEEVKERIEIKKSKRWQPLTNKLNDLLSKEETKKEGGVDYPAKDFAYTPDKENPSTWKLRLAEGEPNNITVAQLGRASAALSPAGFRGNRVQIPSGDIPAVKKRIRDEYKKLGVEAGDIPASVKQSSFQVFKNQDGGMVWVATYSNKFRDDDNPSEIISEASHKRFNEKLKSGEYEYPELWLYHIPIVWGKATTHLYDSSGFSVAAGYVFPEYEWLADHLSKCGVELGVSHGMPIASIKRDTQNPSIITEHQTIEISPLPLVAAANKLTDFSTITEVKMIENQDREKLTQLGLTSEHVSALESGNKAKSEKAESEGIEYKETGTEPLNPEEQKEVKQNFVTRDELNELTSVIAEHIKQLGQELRNELTQVKEETQLQQLELSPAATFKSLISSAIGREETQIDGRTTLAKDAPIPPQKDTFTTGPTGIRFLNNLMTGGKQ